MIINKDVYPDVSVGTYTTVSNPVMDYDADEPLEHSIFYAGSISENVQFCDETNYTYNATAPNCQFSVTPKDIVKGDVFFLSNGFRFFNFNDSWQYRVGPTYDIVTEFDVSKFYFDMNQLTCQVYDISQPDGGHAIGSFSNMNFNTYRSQTAEYKKTHLIRSVTCNYVYGDSTSFCKYKGVASYYDVNVSPMIRYKFNDKTTIYAPVILNSYGLPDWQGPTRLNTLTGSGNFPEQSSDIYSAQYTMFGKWYDTFVPGGPAHMVTAANIGAVDNFTVHAGNDQGQQVNNGYHIPDISNINTDKYMIPVFIWGNNWDKRIVPFFTDEFLMRYIASFGLRFQVDSTMYIGYMQQDGTCNGDYILESQLADSDSANRNITDFSGSNYDANKPYVPPVPSGDDIDAQHFGGGTGLGGAENLWLLTTAQMQSLHAAISSCNEPNFEPLNSIISVMGLAIPPTYPLGTDISTLITITFKKADGTRWSSHVEGHICDKQTAAFGFTNNIKIKRRYNNFLDYPPYANHEIFLPLCGWLPLPAYAVGRNLQVYYVHDINTCSVRALVLCEGSVIGEKYGTMGANIAFSSNGHALYLGGLISGGVQTLADFTTAMISEGPMALMSAMKGVADGANTLISANQNRTSVIGQNQDRTSFADGQYIRIKSTYPDVKIEENFGHTYGFVCNKKGLLKDFKGFTTCENPHVTGFSCTSAEKDEIEQLLKAGIIINISE